MSRKLQEDIEKLPLPWFGSSHGVDNHEEAIDPRYVVSFNALFTVIPNTDTWDVESHLYTKDNHEYQTHLSLDGYGEFLKRVRLCNDMRLRD